MNKQHDLNLNKSMKTALKPLFFISCMLLTFSQSFADTSTSKDMLNELSAEASNTKMANKQSEGGDTKDPTALLKIDGNEAAGDELSEKIERQLRNVLGKNQPDNGEGGESGNTADRLSTEAELEKIVSSSLMEGAKMDDIRSAVGDAMSEIKKEKDSEKAIAPLRITEANKAFSKLTITKKEPVVTKDTEKSEEPKKAATSVSKVAVATSNSDTSHPETVTVQEGESLFKIALRVYGDGNKYYKLYKANEDRIQDPNLLLAGQVLVTPKF